MVPFTWKLRLAIVTTVLWLIVAYMLFNKESGWESLFAMVGILPVALAWGIGWTVTGYVSQRPPEDDDARRERKAALKRRIVGVVLLGASFLVVGYFAHRVGDNVLGRIGYFAGYYIWLPLAAWALWATGFKRRKGALLLIIGVAYASASGWEAYSLNGEYQDLARFATQGVALIRKMESGAVVPHREITDGHFGRFQPTMDAAWAYYSAVYKALSVYRGAVKQAQLKQMIGPSGFSSTESMSESQVRLERLSYATDLAETAVNKANDTFLLNVQSMPGSEEIRTALVKGLEKSIPRARSEMHDYFEIQRSTDNTLIKLTAFMKSKKGKYVVSGRRVLFQNAADLDIYDGYMAQIYQLAQKEVEWRKENQDRAFTILGKMSNLRQQLGR